ncbi:MAG: hypothetical protein ABSA43_01700, partial [Candidatus Microgenomates bacterium]
GILIILFSAFNGFQLIIKQAQPVQFFTLASTNSEIPLNLGGTQVNINPSSLFDSLGLSGTTISFTLNLVFHLLILGFIAKMGFHLASVGSMLVRPIIVDIKSKEGIIKGSE